MFKPANPDSRIPAALQSRTKENAIFQLTLMVVFLGSTYAWEALEQRKLRKQCELAYAREALEQHKLRKQCETGHP